MKTPNTLSTIAEQFIQRDPEVLNGHQETFTDMIVLYLTHVPHVGLSTEVYNVFFFIESVHELLVDLKKVYRSQPDMAIDQAFKNFALYDDPSDAADTMMDWSDNLAELSYIAIMNCDDGLSTEAVRLRRDNIVSLSHSLHDLIKALRNYYKHTANQEEKIYVTRKEFEDLKSHHGIEKVELN